MEVIKEFFRILPNSLPNLAVNQSYLTASSASLGGSYKKRFIFVRLWLEEAGRERREK
jgi:hypothetical protein